MMGYSELEGDGSSNLMVIAESLGKWEEKAGLPLRDYAPSGKVFQKALDLAGIRRSSLTITNILRCKSEAPHPQAAIDHCRQYLDAAVAERRPNLLLALGDVPFKELSLTGGQLSEVRGYVTQSRYGVPMIATYHPSHLARDPIKYAQLYGVFLHDVMQAHKFAREGVPPKVATNYILEPTDANKRNYIERLRGDISLPVAHDTETEDILGVKGPKDWREKKIIQVQFSSGIGEAIVAEFPKEREFVQAVYGTSNMKWGWNCLHINTSIWMFDGSWKAIWKVKPNDLVRTLLEDGTIGIRRVTAAMRKKARGKWLRISVDGGQCRGTARWKNHGVVCTPDHRWLTTNGWKLAQDLNIGDEVYVSRFGDASLIQGTALGDGYISPAGRLTLSHSNYEWAKAKADHFGVNLYKKLNQRSGFKKGSTAYEMGVQVAKEWRKRVYRDDKSKIWTPLSMPALAVFYQDDGWVVKKGYARLCLHSFNSHDVQAAKSWAEAHFGKCSLYKYKSGYALGFLAESSKRLFAAINSYIHPSNYYKLPSQFRGYYNGWMERRVPQIGKVINVEIQGANDRLHSQSEYCVEVEETHNFFTRAGVVANSRLSDRLALRGAGITINGEDHDLMNAFLHLQPNFASGKDAASDEDKGVPAKLANLQSCVSFYYPQEGPYKGMVQAAVKEAQAEYINDPEGPDLLSFVYDRVQPVLRWYGARDSDLTYRVGCKIFASLKKLGLW